MSKQLSPDLKIPPICISARFENRNPKAFAPDATGTEELTFGEPMAGSEGGVEPSDKVVPVECGGRAFIEYETTLVLD